MPANKKYLTKSPFQKFLKITAGFIGGYTVMITFHHLLGYIFEPKNVIITAAFTGYILWAVLLLLAFLAKSGWKIWMYYILLTAIFATPFLLKL
jgi:hypothetical protein